MAKKLNSILLVDDDKDCNYFHQRLFTKMECAENIYVVNNGLEALDFLRSSKTEGRNKADIIFLDLNMPILNGWEFMRRYKKLDDNEKAQAVFVMLSTTLNLADEDEIKQHKEVTGFRNKYLNQEVMEQIITEFFPDHV